MSINFVKLKGRETVRTDFESSFHFGQLPLNAQRHICTRSLIGRRNTKRKATLADRVFWIGVNLRREELHTTTAKN